MRTNATMQAAIELSKGLEWPCLDQASEARPRPLYIVSAQGTDCLFTRKDQASACVGWALANGHCCDYRLRFISLGQLADLHSAERIEL